MESQLDDVDGWIIPDPEAWIDSFTKGGLEAVDEGHGVPHAVEGESAPSVVQENPDAGGVRSIDLRLVLVVAGWVAGVGAEQAPWLTVVANAAVVTVARPLDALVRDSDGSPLPAPVYLPVVGASGEGLPTKDLRQGVKPGRAVAVRLGVFLQDGFSVPTRQVELSVSCVWIKSELASIYGWKEDKF